MIADNSGINVLGRLGCIVNAEQVLVLLIDYISMELDSLEEEEAVRPLTDYASGRKAALVECLELIQRWEDAAKNGLDWDIEANFPV